MTEAGSDESGSDKGILLVVVMGLWTVALDDRSRVIGKGKEKQEGTRVPRNEGLWGHGSLLRSGAWTVSPDTTQVTMSSLASPSHGILNVYCPTTSWEWR